MAFVTPGTINGKQIEEKEKQFRENVFSNPVAAEATLKELHAFFEKSGPTKDWENRASYFRWYTELLWRRLNSQPRDIFLNIAIARQLPLAMLLGIDVWREMMWYLAEWIADDEKDLEEFYEKIKKSFLESRAIVGYWQGKEIAVYQLVNELKTINDRGNNSLEVAEYNAKLKVVMSAKNDPELSKYVLVDPNNAVIRFVDLANFFTGITSDTIWFVVDTFAHPEEIESPVPGEEIKLSATMVKSDQIAPTSSSPAPSIKSTPAVPVITPPQAIINPPFQKKVSEVKVEKNSKISYAEMRAKIESQFRKDQNGQFINISEVLRELQRLAAKFGDDQVRDLYIFSEKDSKFEWNSKLLNK